MMSESNRGKYYRDDFKNYPVEWLNEFCNMTMQTKRNVVDDIMSLITDENTTIDVKLIGTFSDTMSGKIKGVGCFTYALSKLTKENLSILRLLIGIKIKSIENNK
tara:strand:- start:1036 stop:1350 length:315 start_codon:yes stop_codon:yes gene_type:complete